jgi:hypothetical protein
MIWLELISSNGGEAMLHGSGPHGVDAAHFDGADLVVSPPFQGVDEPPGMARVHGVPLHAHLAGAQPLDARHRQLHPCQSPVGAVLPELADGGHHELVEVGAWRCTSLVPLRCPLAHYPCLSPMAV